VSEDTPLHECVQHNLPEAVSALLSHGSDVNSKNKLGLSPLHVALQIRSGPHPFTCHEIVHSLVKDGYNTDVNLPDAHGMNSQLDWLCLGGAEPQMMLCCLLNEFKADMARLLIYYKLYSMDFRYSSNASH